MSELNSFSFQGNSSQVYINTPFRTQNVYEHKPGYGADKDMVWQSRMYKRNNLATREIKQTRI